MPDAQPRESEGKTLGRVSDPPVPGRVCTYSILSLNSQTRPCRGGSWQHYTARHWRSSDPPYKGGSEAQGGVGQRPAPYYPAPRSAMTAAAHFSPLIMAAFRLLASVNSPAKKSPGRPLRLSGSSG